MTIQSIGARGDGVAKLGAARLFVPLTVPGDRLYVRIIGRRGDDLVGTPVEWIAPAARAEPPCPHFGACGGCQLQHLPAAQYRAWKRQQVQMALARQGLDGIRIEPLVNGHPGARRQVRFVRAARRRGSLGFRERSGQRIVDVDVCPVVTPGLVALLPALRALLARLDLARRGGELQITASASGIDLEIIGAPPSLADREALAAFAQAKTWRGSLVLGRYEPIGADRATARANRGIRPSAGRAAARRLPAGDRGCRSRHPARHRARDRRGRAHC